MADAGQGNEPWLWLLRRCGRLIQKKVALRTRLGALIPTQGVRTSKSAGGATALPCVTSTGAAREIRAGDRVRVRDRVEIERTLDQNGRCAGCAFLEPMAQYCGQQFLVLRRVDRFFDEARWRMLKCRNVVLLDGVHCDGSGHPDTRGCDRMCFFFWRTEWLERLE